MSINQQADPIQDSEEVIREMVQGAALPPLLTALAHATGDLSLVSNKLRPTIGKVLATIPAQGGMSEAVQNEARELAVNALLRLRDDNDAMAANKADQDIDIDELLKFLTAAEDDKNRDVFSLLKHELGFPKDLGAPGWSKDTVAPSRNFTVAIIGAGMSGLGLAHRLAQADIPFIILEKNEEVGGTWWENVYPGCRLDTPNFAYSYSFAQKPDWPQEFSPQPVLRDYYIDVADEFDIRRHIRFNTEVCSATFDESIGSWTLGIRGRDGSEQSLRVQAVVPSVGPLNRPSYPDIAGRDKFTGPSMHSGHWDHEVELRGKRVAVIGTGASAFQIIPAIADKTAELQVFQRNPPWTLPTPNYYQDISTSQQWLFQHVPHYYRWYRLWQIWISNIIRRHLAKADPDWHEPGSVSEANYEFRQELIAWLERQYAGHPGLLRKAIPSYPPGAKRMLRDNGVYPDALKKEHVQLVTESISEITENGIVTADGVDHQVDVIIYATGFAARDFLKPMKITGRGGVDLHEQWHGDDARAYLGVTIPNFPNLYCMLGPNTGLVVHGSLIFIAECSMNYIVESIRTLLEKGATAMDCRWEPFNRYNADIDEGNRNMAWGASSVSSWYKNRHGRITNSWPFSLRKYWSLTRQISESDYEFFWDEYATRSIGRRQSG